MKEPLVQAAPLMTRINVTPIIDVALVLVIILLITAPMLSVGDLKVDLPGAHSREAAPGETVNITVDHLGRISVDDQGVADVAALGKMLPPMLHREGALSPESGKVAPVVIRADASLPHALVRQVMDQARAAGATRLAIATRLSGEVRR